MSRQLALVKIGGAQIDTATGRARLGRCVARAREAGWDIVLVHGGGPQIAAFAARLGLEERRHLGLRITDAATAEVVLAALAGTVNKELVRALAATGVPAVGVCGVDGGLFGARRLGAAADSGVDLGYVGEPDAIDPHIVHTLLDAGYVPVVATVASRTVDEPFYNVNADHAAGPLASALAATSLVFLTDVDGVLDAERRPILALDRARMRTLVDSGVITGGMLPKVAAALAALAAAPHTKVRIAPGAGAPERGEHAVLDALLGTTGTAFVEAHANAEVH